MRAMIHDFFEECYSMATDRPRSFPVSLISSARTFLLHRSFVAPQPATCSPASAAEEIVRCFGFGPRL